MPNGNGELNPAPLGLKGHNKRARRHRPELRQGSALGFRRTALHSRGAPVPRIDTDTICNTYPEPADAVPGIICRSIPDPIGHSDKNDCAEYTENTGTWPRPRDSASSSGAGLFIVALRSAKGFLHCRPSLREGISSLSPFAPRRDFFVARV
jgi:hypothetical protein